MAQLGQSQALPLSCFGAWTPACIPWQLSFRRSSSCHPSSRFASSWLLRRRRIFAAVSLHWPLLSLPPSGSKSSTPLSGSTTGNSTPGNSWCKKNKLHNESWDSKSSAPHPQAPTNLSFPTYNPWLVLFRVASACHTSCCLSSGNTRLWSREHCNRNLLEWTHSK